MGTEDTKNRIKTAVDTCKNDLVSCNSNAQELQSKNEKKYSELQQKIIEANERYENKDAEVEALQKKLSAVTTDSDEKIVRLNELYEELSLSQEEYTKAKQLAIDENNRYETELNNLTTRMEEQIEQLNTNSNGGASSVQENMDAVQKMQINFENNIQKLQSKFTKTLDENTQIWSKKYEDIQKLLETKTMDWNLEKINVQSCEQLKTEATNNVKLQIAEILIMRSSIQKIKSERDAIKGELLQLTQDTQSLKLQHHVESQSHFAEISSMKAKVKTLEQLAMTNKDDNNTQLSILRAENDQLKLRITELMENLTSLKTSQTEVVKEVQLAEDQCPVVNCPQVEMNEYLQRLDNLQKELEFLRQEKENLAPRIQSMRKKLAYQTQQLTECYRKVDDASNIDNKVVKTSLLLENEKLIAMQQNINE